MMRDGAACVECEMPTTHQHLGRLLNDLPICQARRTEQTLTRFRVELRRHPSSEAYRRGISAQGTDLIPQMRQP